MGFLLKSILQHSINDTYLSNQALTSFGRVDGMTLRLNLEWNSNDKKQLVTKKILRHLHFVEPFFGKKDGSEIDEELVVKLLPHVARARGSTGNAAIAYLSKTNAMYEFARLVKGMFEVTIETFGAYSLGTCNRSIIIIMVSICNKPGNHLRLTNTEMVVATLSEVIA